MDFGAQGWRDVVERSGRTLAEAVAEVVDAERVAMARETATQLVRVFASP
jgi:hypothetical protein